MYREDCYQCDEYISTVKKIAMNHNIILKYLDTNNLTNDSYNVFELCNIKGTPSMVIIQNGKVLDSLTGSKSKKEIVHFLRKNHII